MAEHTPPPYCITNKDDRSIVTTDGRKVATFPRHQRGGDASPVSAEEAAANADFFCRAANSHDDLTALLIEAHAQITYLHGKFQETGTGNAVLARISSALTRVGVV